MVSLYAGHFLTFYGEVVVLEGNYLEKGRLSNHTR